MSSTSNQNDNRSMDEVLEDELYPAIERAITQVGGTYRTGPTVREMHVPQNQWNQFVDALANELPNDWKVSKAPSTNPGAIAAQYLGTAAAARVRPVSIAPQPARDMRTNAAGWRPDIS